VKFNLLATSAWRRESVVTAACSSESYGQKTVFIVESDLESLRVMRLALAGEAYRVETSFSAEPALRRLRTSPPALILLNTQVLAADGTPFFRRLLRDGRLLAIPIVVLAETGTGTERSPESGSRFDGHIEKPINPQAFPGQVRVILDSLSLMWANRFGDLRLPDAAPGDPWRELADLLDAIDVGLPDSQFYSATQPGLHRLAEAVRVLEHPEMADYLQQAERLSNIATARARRHFRSMIHHCRELVDLEPAVTPGFATLREQYLDRRYAELSNLQQSLKNRDFAVLAKAGHNLKGMGAAYGFSELTDIGRAIEAAVKEADAALIEDLLAQIDTYIGLVRPSPE
jgi:CheY-like chemotaxis protein